MTAFHSSRIFAAATAILVASAAAAYADDPPGRVGRLSDIEGTVSFHTADQTDWSPATLNYPITTGSSLWTEPNSRTEVQIGPAEVRMDQGSWVDVMELDDNATQLRINQGALNIHLAAVPQGGVTVMTPMGQVDLLQPGSYDINAGAPDGSNPPSQMQLSVLEGDARFDGPKGTVDLQAGEAATIGGDPLNVTMGEAAPTPFDDWALAREHREMAAEAAQPPAAQQAAQQAAQYVPPTMTGYQDLDANGQWATTPNYGPVWYPTAVPAGWAPYQYGHWAYVAPWGWTWVDDAPWGFAPFHYGRWAMVDGRWGWCPVVPGAVVGVPVYAPALVAFVGGGGFGVSLSIGGPVAAVGWVPLAPFEFYRPWYHVSPAYVRNVNIINVNRTVIDRINVHDNFTVDHFANHNSAVVVTATAFTHAAPVQRAVVAVPHEQLAQVHMAANMRDFHATADARAGFAHPNAVPEMHPGMQAAVSRQPVPFHEAPEPRGPQAAAAGPHAPGPQIHQNAAMVRPGARPEPAAGAHLQSAPAPRPPSATAAAPAPRPQAERPTQAATRPAPRPTPQASPARPVVQRPAPRPQMQVQHPVQAQHLTATPQGWKRQAAPAHEEEKKKQQ